MSLLVKGELDVDEDENYEVTVVTGKPIKGFISTLDGTRRD